MGRVRASYTAKEKLAAISYAEAHGNRAAGREFSVNEACVRRWRQQKSALLRTNKTRKANRGSRAKFPQLEQPLLQFILDRRRRGIGVSTVEVGLEARKIADTIPELTQFKASCNWIYRFLKRHDMSIRRRTHISQKLPEDHADKLLEFQRFIINIRKQHDFVLSQIGNADQTPLTFDLPTNTTISEKGASTVSITTTGNEKNRFTVMLACTADGGKLPPYVVFKRKTLPKGIKWPAGILVRCHEKGWMDTASVRDWVMCVWGRRPGGLSKKSLLVLDAFRAHRTDDVKALLKDEYRTNLAIIPGGMTCILQPLDVAVNRPMKRLLQLRWNKWYADGPQSLTAGGRRRKPELEEICKWIAEEWQALDPQIIIRGFKRCCISNAMDGTEDDILFDDQILQSSTSSKTTAEDDDASDDDCRDDVYYTDDTHSMTEIDLEKFLDSDTDASDFEGFDEDDIRSA